MHSHNLLQKFSTFGFRYPIFISERISRKKYFILFSEIFLEKIFAS